MSAIKHVFVLMLENRSFDHMLGFSNLRGRDPFSGQRTQIAGLQGNEENTYQSTPYRVKSPADFSMTVGPGHEFPDVLEQLSGTGAQYPTAGKYPPITNSGFVENFVASGGQQNPGEVMKCFGTGQLPVLTALANNFAVCDNWFSSLPGPTWPNRAVTFEMREEQARRSIDSRADGHVKSAVGDFHCDVLILRSV